MKGAILNSQSMSQYLYCLGNPHKYTDPAGMSPSSSLIYYNTLSCLSSEPYGNNDIRVLYERREVTRLKDKVSNGGFLEIRESASGSPSYFGGDQIWFESTYNSDGVARSGYGSCGVIAAANMLAYLGKHRYRGIDQNTFLSLVPFRTVSDNSMFMSDYMLLANNIYDNYLTPLDMNKITLVDFLGVRVTVDDALDAAASALDLIGKSGWAKELRELDSLGAWPLSRYENAVVQYAADRGKSLRAVSTSNYDRRDPNSLARGAQFIHDALLRNLPVTLYLTINPSGNQLGSADRHYMTITQIERIYRFVQYKRGSKIIGSKPETLFDVDIDVSSWGIERTINFQSIWFDSTMDDMADRLINTNINVGSGWLGGAFSPATNTLNILPEIGGWLDNNIDGVYLTYFE